MKKYTTVIGIDVSKEHLDVCVYSDHKAKSFKMSNCTKGYNQIKKLIGTCKDLLVCLEHTGIYAFPLCGFMSNQGIDYTLVPAAQIKKSIGIQRGKNDKADAVSIAKYGYLFQDDLIVTELPEKLIMKLKLLYSLRERFVRAKNSISMPAKEMRGFIDKDLVVSIQRSSKQVADNIQKHINSIEKEMITLIQSDKELNRAFNLCSSVPGIGPQISIYLLITTRAFKCFTNARQFACYSGIAPFEYSSGSSIKGRSRVSHLANKKAKSLLSMGAINAIRHDRELKAYFERKVKEGKNKMSVINAVRNKLIARVFATINRGTPYMQLAKY